MTTPNPQIDKYISAAADFAQPVLLHLRNLIIQADPDIQETIKWGMPTFEHDGLVCHFAAFKHHCSFVIQHALLLSNQESLNSESDSGMGQLGKIKNLADLPDDSLIQSWIKQAVQLNLKGVKSTRYRAPKPVLLMPEDFQSLLEVNSGCKTQFEAFAPGYQRDYIEWVVSAKTDKTRQTRMATAVQWILEGKHLNWKYEK